MLPCAGHQLIDQVDVAIQLRSLGRRWSSLDVTMPHTEEGCVPAIDPDRQVSEIPDKLARMTYYDCMFVAEPRVMDCYAPYKSMG